MSVIILSETEEDIFVKELAAEDETLILIVEADDDTVVKAPAADPETLTLIVEADPERLTLIVEADPETLTLIVDADDMFVKALAADADREPLAVSIEALTPASKLANASVAEPEIVVAVTPAKSPAVIVTFPARVTVPSCFK